jgi:hypothetical protein
VRDILSRLVDQNAPSTRRKKQLTLEQHQKIATWLTDPIVTRMVCDIRNTYGKTSHAGRYAAKLADVVMNLKSEMENMAHADGHGAVATDTYYPARMRDLAASPESK